MCSAEIYSIEPGSAKLDGLVSEIIGSEISRNSDNSCEMMKADPNDWRTFISALSLRILVRRPTLIGFDLPLTSLIGIARKRKKILTCRQETTRAKLERLCSARLIHHDQKITARHAKALNKADDLISLLAPTLSIIKHAISQIKLINLRRFAS
jgi:hypothetical protein